MNIKNNQKFFKGGTTQIYLFIIIIAIYAVIELADNNKNGIPLLTQDYTQDEILKSILFYLFFITLFLLFKSEYLYKLYTKPFFEKEIMPIVDKYIMPYLIVQDSPEGETPDLGETV